MLLRDKKVFYYDGTNRLIPIPNKEEEKEKYLESIELIAPSFTSQMDAAHWFQHHFKDKIHLHFVEIFDNGTNNLIFHIVLDKETYPLCEDLIGITKGEEVDLFLFVKTTFIAVIIDENGHVDFY